MDRTPYPAALRLYAIAEQRWAEVDAAYYQVNILGFRPSRFLNCVYTWCLERIPPDKREQWEMMLEAPLPGKEKVVTERQLELESEGFMGLLAMQQAKKEA